MRPALLLLPLLFSCVLIAGCLLPEVETTIDYRQPPPKPEDELKDDKSEDRPVLPFDPELADRRPLDGWLINNSAAVFKLDVPALKPDKDQDLQTLYPSYADACKAAATLRPEVTLLPSVNFLDGKAKQFDDGLYAAIDLAYYGGLGKHLRSHVDLIRTLHSRASAGSDTEAFLTAGLKLAGVSVKSASWGKQGKWLREFEKNESASKPAGFYTWNDELKKCFRFLRFFQQTLPSESEIVRTLHLILAGDPALQGDYLKAVNFYRKLSNRSACCDLTNYEESKPGERERVKNLFAVYPSSGSRESTLFASLFSLRLPPDTNLMDVLIRAVRSGKLDLRPRPDSGWYEYQVHALETFLLPERGEEHAKLLLTQRYKKRMMEAFKALITKRRETHLRQMPPIGLGAATPLPAPMPKLIAPRLRIEPCASYYVRTARAYAFLLNFLESTVGESGLRTLHGLREDRPQSPDLYTELKSQRDLFYGLYLMSCEDLGMKPAFAKEEPIDSESCYRCAIEWLPKALDDPDLARDTRVSVPIANDPQRNVTRLWATLGVRLNYLEASYVHPPRMKPTDGGDWQDVDKSDLIKKQYLICVDEFAEAELRGQRVLTREELRNVCNRGKTKAGILTNLQQ